MTSPLARISVPIPTDATHDYVPVDARDIQVGDDILALFIGQGGVFLTPGPLAGWWFYIVVGEDGQLGGALFPEDPESLSDPWVQRAAIWKVADKPADAETLTVGGSGWIYPAGEDGRMVCFSPGSGHVRGERAYRGAVLTDPRDLWIGDDPEFDWLPVTDGSTIVVGDTVRYLATATGVVSDLVPFDDTVPFTDWRIRGVEILGDEGAVNLGRWSEPDDPAAPPLLNFGRWFRRLPKPPDGSKFSAADGSRWIHTAGSYYCFGRGRTYAPGSIFLRGEIAGGLTPIA